MKSFTRIAVAMTSLLIGHTLHAGILVEPYIGYETGTIKNTAVGSTTENGGKVSGLQIGGRFGYTFPIFLWTAVDYSFVNGAKLSGTQPNTDGKVDRADLYLTLGFDFPIMLRAWAGYGLMNKAIVKLDGENANTFSSGTAYKVGVGLTTFPIIDVNLEYIQHSPNKVEGDVTDFAGSFSDYTDSRFVLSLSAPFDF